jgi:hypothetical protein
MNTTNESTRKPLHYSKPLQKLAYRQSVVESNDEKWIHRIDAEILQHYQISAVKWHAFQIADDILDFTVTNPLLKTQREICATD